MDTKTTDQTIVGAQTPKPPYYVVIFASKLSNQDPQGYEQMANRMQTLAAQQAGFLGIESARNDDGSGITVSYWQDTAAIKAWKDQLDHQQAQHYGRSRWYRSYQVRIAKVEREYSSHLE